MADREPLCDLLDRVARAGARIVTGGGANRLVLPADPVLRAQALALVPLLAGRREEIREHFERLGEEHDDGILRGDAHPGKRCGECRAFVFTDDPRDMPRLCCLVHCPLRVPDRDEQARRNRARWAARRGGG